MTYEHIQYDVSDAIATITLNRPDKLNAWTPQMQREVFDAATAADRDDDVRVILLTGAGRGFCAGADMSNLDAVSTSDLTGADPATLAGRFTPEHELEGVRDDFRKTYAYFPSLSKPVIAAVNGVAVGLGLVMALYCDIRIASDKARFGTAFSRRGLIAEHGISWMLPRLVGIPHALDLLFSARLIEAEEALAMGLVNRVLPVESLIDGARSYAAELASRVSPRSMRVIKRQAYDALFQTLGDAIDVANREMIESFQCQDFREGVAHFLEKRPPVFTGR